MEHLKAGDVVELVAPASGCSSFQVQQLKALLESWGLLCQLKEEIFGADLLCANSDEQRFLQLKEAFLNPESQAVICVRGGYGAQRLLPALFQMPKPAKPKLLVGMSDITALHLFLQQQWHWPTVHASTNVMHLTEDSILALKSFLMGALRFSLTDLKPLNALAEKEQSLVAPITGGNLALVQTSIGTPWHMQAAGKIILLEEINERAYRVDRMLNHLQQAAVFNEAKAIIFGDFIGGDEPDGRSLMAPVLERFASESALPVLQLQGVGHGAMNSPLLLGSPSRLTLGESAKLSSLP